MNETVLTLLAGNDDHAREFQSRFDDVQDAQHPAAVTVGCSDSRVLQDHVFGNETPGYLFTCSNIGNRVVQATAEGTPVSGDVLYPIVHAATDTVIVMGHTGCGAVTATYDALTDDVSDAAGIEHCIGLLKPHLERGVAELPADVARDDAINRLVEYNVDRQIDFLLGSDEVPDDVTAVGIVYDFQDVYGGRRGEVHVVNVDGETSVDRLQTTHPEIETRIRRLWEY